jgi:hypothetical protein
MKLRQMNYKFKPLKYWQVYVRSVKNQRSREIYTKQMIAILEKDKKIVF